MEEKNGEEVAVGKAATAIRISLAEIAQNGDGFLAHPATEAPSAKSKLTEIPQVSKELILGITKGKRSNMLKF